MPAYPRNGSRSTRPPAGRLRAVLAVAAGNASLLGLGYWLLRRPVLAVGALLGTVALVLSMVASAQPGVEVALLVWWVALIGHGGLLASRRSAGAVRRWPGMAAIAGAVAVLLALGLLRAHADGVGGAVADARRAGDCAQARQHLDRVGFWTRAGNPPLAAGNEHTAEACRHLRYAQEQLNTALRTGRTHGLTTGFRAANQVLSTLPGHAAVTRTALTRFLATLPGAPACRTATVTDWLRAHQSIPSERRRIDRAVARTAPSALVQCADRLVREHRYESAAARFDQVTTAYASSRYSARAEAGFARSTLARADQLLAGRQYDSALDRYRQIATSYAHSGFSARASAGVTRATLAGQLHRVRELLRPDDVYGDEQPAYCTQPARYAGAPPYRRGLNPGLFYPHDADSGHRYNGDYEAQLPGGWRVSTVERATLIVCAGPQEMGTRVQTCPYKDPLYVAPIGGTAPHDDVTFYKIAVPVQAYELRTGRLVVRTTVQIDGTSCPHTLPYQTALKYGPPPDKTYVDASAAQVQAAFRRVFVH